MKIGFQVESFAGHLVQQCHILKHEETGIMSQYIIIIGESLISILHVFGQSWTCIGIESLVIRRILQTCSYLPAKTCALLKEYALYYFVTQPEDILNTDLSKQLKVLE